MDNNVLAKRIMPNRLLLFLLAVLTVLQYSCRSKSAEAEPEGPITAQESPFNPNTVLTAAVMDRNQISFGELGTSKGNETDVRNYSLLIFNDFTAAQNELQALCDKKGLTMQDEMSTTHFQFMEQLMDLEGTSFDSAFMSQQLKDHDDIINVLNTALQSTDEDLKSFARNLLPRVELHKAQTEEIVKKLNFSRAAMQGE